MMRGSANFLLSLGNLLAYIGTGYCARSMKEASRPSTTRCQKNITTFEHSQSINFSQRCIVLNNPYCLDIKLPYNATYVPDYLPDLNLRYFDDVKALLQRWHGAKKLPKCWPLLQVALCSLLMPQCEEDHSIGRVSRIYKSNTDICSDLVNRTECRYIERHANITKFDWSSIFNCSDTNLYAKNCTNELRGLKYNQPTQHSCQYPLVPSNNEKLWFKDIFGCSLDCKFPISGPDYQESISFSIRVLSLAGLVVTAMAVALLRFNQTGSKVSSLNRVIRHCLVCQFLFYTGWSLQILHTHDIACSQSGSPLYGLPLVANSCVLSFFLTYLPSMSSLFWCAQLGKLCYETLMEGEKKQRNDEARSHRTQSMFSYGIPLTLLASVALLGEIDGNGLYGICTVGQREPIYKLLFILVPTFLGTVCANFYYLRIIRKLLSRDSMPPRVRSIFSRISALATLTILQALVSMLGFYYECTSMDVWKESVYNYVGCSLKLNVDIDSEDYGQGCEIDMKPIVTLYWSEVFLTLTPGLVIASWAFSDTNIERMRKKLIKLLEVKEKDRTIQDSHSLQDEAEATHHLTSPTRDRAADPPPSLDSVSLYRYGISNRDSLTSRTTRYKAAEKHADSFMTSRDVINDARRQQQQQQDMACGETDLQREPNLTNMLDYYQLISMMMQFNQKSQAPNSSEPQFSDPDKLMSIVSFMHLSQQFNPPDLSDLQSDPDRQPRLNHGLCSNSS